MSATHPRPRTLLPALLLALFACRDSTGPSSRELGQIELDSVVVVLEGGTAQLGIRYVDRSGAPMEHPPKGLVLRWTSLDTTVAIVRAGRVTGMRAGETEIRLEAASLTASARVRVQPAAPTLVVLGGQGQTGGRREALDRTLDVLVLDAHRLPMRDAEVEFVATAGGGTLSPAVLRTDSTGRASASWTLGAVRGEQTAEARVRGPGAAPLAFTARAIDQIAFTSIRDGNAEIYLVNEDGSRQRNLSLHPATDEQPQWSPDGTKILFASDRDGRHELYVMGADGSGLTRLTHHGVFSLYGHALSSHSWSPDGTRIVFVSANGDDQDVYVMNADGSNQRNVTNDPRYDAAPAWSPDGTRIAFVSSSPETGGFFWKTWLFLINADGSSRRALLTLDYLNQNTLRLPRWSPDGTTIAYTSQWKAYGADLYCINADGTGVRRMSPPFSPFTNPAISGHAWSPDGRTLAYSWTYWNTSIGQWVLRLVDADGTQRGVLMREPDGGERDDAGPSWSPDGSRLAFTRTREGGAPQVYVVPVDGSSGEARLTVGPEANSVPVWRP